MPTKKKPTVWKRSDDDGSCLQKSQYTDSKLGAKDDQIQVSPYLFLSENEKGEVLRKIAEERKRKLAEEKEKAEKAKKPSKKSRRGESGFSMIAQDVTNIFRRNKNKNKEQDPTKQRQEAMRKRTAAKYLKLILTGERNEPELCPRIFAILLIWLIIVIIISGIVYFQTSWLQPFKVLIGASTYDLGCFAQMDLILRNGSIIEGTM